MWITQKPFERCLHFSYDSQFRGHVLEWVYIYNNTHTILTQIIIKPFKEVLNHHLHPLVYSKVKEFYFLSRGEVKVSFSGFALLSQLVNYTQLKWSLSGNLWNMLTSSKKITSKAIELLGLPSLSHVIKINSRLKVAFSTDRVIDYPSV